MISASAGSGPATVRPGSSDLTSETTASGSLGPRATLIRRIGRTRIRPATAILVVAVLASGTLLLLLERHLTFVFDDWDFLAHRQGFSAAVFLDPHNEHIAILPVAIYKFLLAVFGMGSPLPFQVVATVLFEVAAVLLFVYLRRRSGEWLALIATTIVLFLGPAWIDLLWSFQLAFSGSAAAGLGMLLALQTETRKGDRLACALLAVSLAFSSFGLAFAAGAVIDCLLGRRPRRSRAYVAALPLAFFALWWLGWGHTAENSVGWQNARGIPNYVFDAVGQVLASVTGLAGSSNPDVLGGLFWGHRILVVVVLLGAWRFWRLGHIPRQFLVVLAIGAGFWVLAALNASLLRPPTTGRYQYPGAVCLFLILAELVRGIRLRPLILAVAGVATVAVLVSNIGQLYDGYSKRFRPYSEATRGQLAALDIARPSIRPGFALSIFVGWIQPMSATQYFSAVHSYGSPAYTISELSSASDTARQGADSILVPALGMRLSRIPALPRHGRCGRVQPLSGRVIRTGPGTILFTGITRRTHLLIGRYANGFPISLGNLEPGKPARLTIPPDLSKRVWRINLAGGGVATVCKRPWMQPAGA